MAAQQGALDSSFSISDQNIDHLTDIADLGMEGTAKLVQIEITQLCPVMESTIPRTSLQSLSNIEVREPLPDKTNLPIQMAPPSRKYLQVEGSDK